MRGSNRRGLVSAGLVALLGSAFLVACGGDAKPPSTATPGAQVVVIDPSRTAGPSATPDGTPTERWLRRFCVAFSGYGEDVSALGDGFAVSNTASANELKGALVSFLGDAATRTHKFKQDVDGLGAAPISDGQNLQTELSGAATDVVTIFDSALTDARALDTADRTALAARASEISQRIETGFGAVGDAFDAIDTKYDTGELSKAATAIPECAILFD